MVTPPLPASATPGSSATCATSRDWRAAARAAGRCRRVPCCCAFAPLTSGASAVTLTVSVTPDTPRPRRQARHLTGGEREVLSFVVAEAGERHLQGVAADRHERQRELAAIVRHGGHHAARRLVGQRHVGARQHRIGVVRHQSVDGGGGDLRARRGCSEPTPQSAIAIAIKRLLLIAASLSRSGLGSGLDPLSAVSIRSPLRRAIKIARGPFPCPSRPTPSRRRLRADRARSIPSASSRLARTASRRWRRRPCGRRSTGPAVLAPIALQADLAAAVVVRGPLLLAVAIAPGLVAVQHDVAVGQLRRSSTSRAPDRRSGTSPRASRS